MQKDRSSIIPPVLPETIKMEFFVIVQSLNEVIGARMSDHVTLLPLIRLCIYLGIWNKLLLSVPSIFDHPKRPEVPSSLVEIQCNNYLNSYLQISP